MITIDGSAGEGGGQILRTLYTPGFARVWTGSMFWYAARWMELFVLQWQVLVMTDSAFQVSLIGFYRMVPLFLFGAVAGLIADRFDRRKVVLFAQAWNGAAAAAMPSGDYAPARSPEFSAAPRSPVCSWCWKSCRMRWPERFWG